MSLFSRLFSKAPAPVVHIESNDQPFTVNRGETVLESALKNGISYPHDCTVGTCGACRTRLISGKIEAITPFGYALSRDELAGGYILACQALAKTDLVINVDISQGAPITPTEQPARVVAITDLTHDIKRFTIEIDKPLNYKAGQYANLTWGDAATSRSYSFANAPSAGGAQQLSFFIRHVPGGAFTDQLFNGDVAALPFRVNGPHGNFWLREGKGPILCLAGGSGLAPIISLLQDAANRRVRRDCTLLFGARTPRDLYGDDELTAIRNAWTAGFDVWPVVAEPGTDDAADRVRRGLVTEYIGAAIEKLGPGTQAYLCGPPGMIDAAIAALIAHGIDIADIYYDK
ncbi:MAG: 2Fe-2S iron-sulfur cluster-binding protein, partial [Sphingopyxis sp.]